MFLFPTAVGISLQEQSVYGSARLGLSTTAGKQYELVNHLGNVLVTVSDQKTGMVVVLGSVIIMICLVMVAMGMRERVDI
jgi:hypothetical protein